MPSVSREPAPVGTDLTSVLARLDGCPECVENTEAPRAVTPTRDGWMAAYLCADCGHSWTTSWSL